MKILVVDDRRERHKLLDAAIERLWPGAETTFVERVKTACMFAASGEWDVVYLDHDAGLLDGDFFPVAIVCALNRGVKEVRVHSDNEPAARGMIATMKDIRGEAMARRVSARSGE